MEFGTFDGKDAGLIGNRVPFDGGQTSFRGRIAHILCPIHGTGPVQGHFVANCVDLLDPMFSMTSQNLSRFLPFDYAAKV
jgi:hypothetical protein